MNIDVLGEEHIIDKNFYDEFNENLFHSFVAYDILETHMEGGRQGAGQQSTQRMVVVNPMRNLPKFSSETPEPADNHLGAFDENLTV